MILKTFVLITILVNNVRSGIITKDGNKNARRGAYNLNHPPPAEYFSVPVAVFYEEGNRQEKSVEISVSTPKPDVTLINDEKEAVELSVTTLRSDGDLEHTQEITEKTTAETTPKISLSTDAFVTSSIMPLDLKQQDNKEIENTANKIPLPQKETIIPVAVVYDVEPENVNKRHHKHLGALTNKSVNRRQRNKNTTKESEIPKKQETKSQPDAITSDTNIKTGTFPKRTGGKDPVVPIIQSENYVFSHSGDFHYSYEGGDGTKAFEKGALNADKAGEAVEGSFSYIGKDGKDYSLTYTADENGYRPIGAHLPTPPPIPPAIARALKYLATKPTPEGITESYY